MDFSKVVEDSFASIEKDDLRVLLPIVDQIKPTRILEIGAWKGYSANMWVNAFKPKTFITLEIQSEEELMPMRIPNNTGHQMWFESDSHDPTVLDTLKIYLPEIDFLFIDGDHSFKGVQDDFRMYSSLVRRGGIIAFHDAVYHADGSEEVDMLWQEMKMKYPYVEIKVGKNSTGIGVIFV